MATIARAASPEPFFARGARLDKSEAIAVKALDRGTLSVARYRLDRPRFGITTPNIPAETLMAVVRLSEYEACEMWRDDRFVGRNCLPKGGLCLIDLRSSWVTDLIKPFHSVNFFFPRQTFADLAREMRAPGISGLDAPITTRSDEVMLNLARAMIPAFGYPREVSRLFADHIAAAAALHLACTYGGVKPAAWHGGLALWQERRAKDLLMANLAGEISLEELAGACGLSVGHFSRSFRRTTGEPPHRWLIGQRIARAQALLAEPSRSLGEIAAACGFADQSHFTRAFARATGATPGAWRRQRLS